MEERVKYDSIDEICLRWNTVGKEEIVDIRIFFFSHNIVKTAFPKLFKWIDSMLKG